MKAYAATALALSLLPLSIGSVLAAPPAGVERSLRVEMAPIQDKLAGDYLGEVRFTMRNPSDQPIRILRWQTPFDGVDANLFSIHVGGEKVVYTGHLIKRGAPTPADYLTLAPGESRSIDLDLSAYYDFAKTGQYEIRYDEFLYNERGMAKQVNTMPTIVWIDGSDQFLGSRVERDPWHGMGVKALNPNPTFTKCTTSQQSQLLTAVNSARDYAINARDYYPAHSATNISARYTTWFGGVTAARYSTATSHFNAIDAAFANQTINIDCGCKKQYYAYVYPTQPYKIYVCRAFWSAPNTGTDSRAGTLIHEMSHFNVVAGTDDHAYGQTAAANLAISNPTNALDNADNHEYFSENTPAQN